MPINIPLESNPSLTFTSSVEDSTYSFRLRWNSREKSWRLDIREIDGTPIVQGLKLTPNQNLTLGYKDPRLPTGNFYILDEDGVGNRPTLDSLGDIQKLLYYTKDEEDELRKKI